MSFGLHDRFDQLGSALDRLAHNVDSQVCASASVCARDPQFATDSNSQLVAVDPKTQQLRVELARVQARRAHPAPPPHDESSFRLTFH